MEQKSRTRGMESGLHHGLLRQCVRQKESRTFASALSTWASAGAATGTSAVTCVEQENMVSQLLFMTG